MRTIAFTVATFSIIPRLAIGFFRPTNIHSGISQRILKYSIKNYCTGMPAKSKKSDPEESSPSTRESQIWLMKNEPEEYSLDHLERDVCGVWDGIRNYQARNFMRSMKIGDKAYFYYSSCAQPGIYGVMRIAGPTFPDPKAVDPTSDYYDARSTAAGKNPWDAITVRMECRYKNPLFLPRIRELPLGECRMTARGNRLSIFPLSVAQSEIIDQELQNLNSSSGDIVYADPLAVPTATKPVIEESSHEEKRKNSKKRKMDSVEPFNTNLETDEEKQHSKAKKTKAKIPATMEKESLESREEKSHSKGKNAKAKIPATKEKESSKTKRK
jgi:predicted RNA-binding protein with PUA-like domain